MATPGADMWPPGEGRMARLIREHDWAASPLGPSKSWSERLKAWVEIVVASRQAMYRSATISS